MGKTQNNFSFVMDMQSPESLKVFFDHFGEPMRCVFLQCSKDHVEELYAKYFENPQAQ